MLTRTASIRNILVLIDFSEIAQQAFQVALQLAAKSSARVKLLHVIEVPLASGYGAFPAGIEMNLLGNYQGYDFILPELLEQSRQQMERFIQEGHRYGIPMDQEIVTDTGISKLIQVVTEEHIDLVVIGSEGADGLEEFLIGSDAEDVVRHCPCPVLTIKQKHETFKVNRILFPSDFASEVNQVVPYLTLFQEFFGAQINLLYVRTGDENLSDAQIHERMQDFVTQNQLINANLIIQAGKSASEGIEKVVNDMPHDLILMPTHARTGLAHIFHKSIAESVVNHAAVPVLTFHYPEIAR